MNLKVKCRYLIVVRFKAFKFKRDIFYYLCSNFMPLTILQISQLIPMLLHLQCNLFQIISFISGFRIIKFALLSLFVYKLYINCYLICRQKTLFLFLITTDYFGSKPYQIRSTVMIKLVQFLLYRYSYSSERVKLNVIIQNCSACYSLVNLLKLAPTGTLHCYQAFYQ